MDIDEKKVVLITGGTSGIGEACVREFSDRGAITVFTGRNNERGRLLEESLTEAGKKVLFYQADSTSDNDIIALKDYIEKEFLRLDVLFNNSGVYPIEPALEEQNREDFLAIFNQNIASVMMMTKAFLPLLRISRGTIINNASVAGLEAYTIRSSYAYGGSKSAVIKFSKMLAKKYGAEVRTNCICPGTIKTPIFVNFDEEARSSAIPMKRTGRPEEVAKVVCFLASDDASYVNGAVVTIDGGQCL